MSKRIIKFFILASAVVCFIIYTSLAISAEKRAKKDDLYREVNLFADCFAIIQDDYVEDVESRQLIYGALKGMLASLDPHSQFMDPDTYN